MVAMRRKDTVAGVGEGGLDLACNEFENLF